MLEKYEKHLNKITDEINSCFEQQKEYIKCQKGCSICCSNGYYPISELEYSYIKKGLENFSKEEIEALQKKALDIFKQRKEFLKTHSEVKDFEYVCPFLKDNSCCVYQFRPLICRSHGLIINEYYDSLYSKKTKSYMPHCVNLGLNYAQIYDIEKKAFCYEKVKELGLKTKPQAYYISCPDLMNSFEETTFGDIRMIYEWIIMDIPDYEKIIKNVD